MSSIKIINVECKNGHILFEKYRKVKSGNLLKCYISEIGIDHVGVSGLINGVDVFCPVCHGQGTILRIGRVSQVHGRPAVVVDHGGIKPVRT